jgi:hypothetical protein
MIKRANYLLNLCGDCPDHYSIFRIDLRREP